MRQTQLRAEEGAARVDLVHQIEALHVGVWSQCRTDGTGVVYQNVDATESLYRMCDSLYHLCVIPNINSQRERAAPGGFNLGRCGVNRAGELGVRLRGLGRDRDVCAIGRSPQGDGQADSAA